MGIELTKVGFEAEDAPCHICQKLYNLAKASKLYKNGRRRKTLKLYHTLLKSHPKCGACGVLFGEYHVSFPVKTSEGLLCNACAKVLLEKGKALHMCRIDYAKKVKDDSINLETFLKSKGNKINKPLELLEL